MGQDGTVLEGVRLAHLYHPFPARDLKYHVMDFLNLQQIKITGRFGGIPVSIDLTVSVRAVM